MFGALPHGERLSILLDGLCSRTSRVLATGACSTCDAPMMLRATARLDDTMWTLAADNGARFDHESIIDRLRDVAPDLYSYAVAHRGILGSWPWEHTHRPAVDPESTMKHAEIVAAHERGE